MFRIKSYNPVTGHVFYLPREHESIESAIADADLLSILFPHLVYTVEPTP